MIKTVIIDSNPKDRKNLKQLLASWGMLDVVAETDNLIAGIRIINTHAPQLVFCELELPESSGFRLMEGFDDITFKTVFITNRKRDAIKAFRVAAAGYLLKPITMEILRRPLNHLVKLLTMKKQVANNLTEKNRFVLPAPSGFHYLVPTEIAFFSSDGKNTIIHKVDQSQLTVPKSLKDAMLLINDPAFIRIHRSFAINLHHIKQYNRGTDIHVVMDNGVRLDVGKQFKPGLDDVVGQVLR